MAFVQAAANCNGFTCSGESDAIKKAYFGAGCNGNASVTGSCSDTITINVSDTADTGATSKLYIDLVSSDHYQIEIVPPTTNDENANCIGFGGSYDAKNGNYSYTVTGKGTLNIFFAPYAKYSTAGCESSYNNVNFSYSVTVHRTTEIESSNCTELSNSFPESQQNFVETACTSLNPSCTAEETKNYYSQLYTCCDGDLACITQGSKISWDGAASYQKLCKNSSVCNGNKLDSETGLYCSYDLGLKNTCCDSNVPWDDVKQCSDVAYGATAPTPPIAINLDTVNELEGSALNALNPLKNSSYFSSESNRTPGAIINRAMTTVVFPIAGIALFVLIIWGGFQMLQASLSGKQNYIDLGKKRVTTAIIGFVLLFAAYWIWRLVTLALGISS